MDAFDAACAAWSAAERAALDHVIALGLSVEPGAVRAVAYGAPALAVRGRSLVGVSRSARHLALVPYSPAALDAVREELSGFVTTKGLVRFRPEQPVPDRFVLRVIRARAAEIARS